MKTKNFRLLSRRQFLRYVGTAIGGGTLAACMPVQVQPQSSATVGTPQVSSSALGDPLEVEVMWRGPTNPVNKDGELYKELVARTGVAYDGFGHPPGPDYTQRVHAVMASGTPPDLMWINDRLAYIQYAKQGAFWPLDSFLEDNVSLPHITAYPQEAYDALRVDGSLYAIPSVRIYRGFPVHIRTDWLEKLGLEMPTTVDELWIVAEAFAKQDPDGNGQDDTYGLMWWQNLSGLDQILNGFGIVSSWEEDSAGRIIPVFTTEKQKNLLTWLRLGIEAGIFDPDSIIMKREEAETVKGNAGKTGIFYTGLGGLTLNEIQKNIPDAQLMPLPPLKTPEGEYVYGIPFLSIGFWSVTKSVEQEADVMKVLKFVDFGSSPEGAELLEFGLPGSYDVNPDGSKTVNEKGIADGAAALWLIPPPDKYLYATIEQSTGHPELAEAQRELVDSVEPVLFYDPIIFTFPGSVELEKGADLARRRDEVFAQILASQLPIDAFDDWVAEWMTNGGEQIIEERNSSYTDQQQ